MSNASESASATAPAVTAPAPGSSIAQALYTPAVAMVLCPGQGAQHVGMGKSWADKYEISRKTFAEADEVLGFELTKLCWEGPEDVLSRTDNAQAAIYTASVACFRALMQEGKLARIGVVAGLSLGEFTALHLAGAYDFATGLQLVRLRGQAMQEAAEAQKGSMVALVGSDDRQAGLLCETVLRGTSEVLVPANYNCPGQIVLSGSLAACQRAVEMADQMGIKATPLKVAGAFHSPLMKPAAERLKAALDTVAWQNPTVPVMSNVTGIMHEINKPDYIKQRLVDQLTGPVRWEQSMIWLITHVPGHFVELAPGKVLTGLMKRIDRTIKVANHADPA